MRRAKDDDRGSTFVIEIPLLKDTKLDPSKIAKDLLRAKCHIEGFAYVAFFCYGHFKMLLNHNDKKFHMELMNMKIYELFESTGIISVGKDNVATASGELASWFTVDFAKQVADQIVQAAQPLVDAVDKKKKEDCNGIVGFVKCGVLDLAKSVVGAAADGVAFIIENVGKLVTDIFTLKTAKFELTLDLDSGKDTTSLELDLSVRVLGKDKSGKVTVDLKDLQSAAVDIAKKFASEIFTEAEKMR